MNLPHIEAVMKIPTGTSALRADFGEVRLASNGHIACALAAPDTFKEYPKLAEQWAEWNKSEPCPSEIDGLLFNADDKRLFYRKIGVALVNEAYFRCFAGDGVTWTASARNCALLVHERGKLIAVVMPARPRLSEPPIEGDVPDSAVFESFANEMNDYYLAPDKGLLRELRELEDELDSLEEHAEFIQEDIRRCERKIAWKNTAILAKREAMKA